MHPHRQDLHDWHESTESRCLVFSKKHLHPHQQDLHDFNLHELTESRCLLFPKRHLHPHQQDLHDLHESIRIEGGLPDSEMILIFPEQSRDCFHPTHL